MRQPESETEPQSGMVRVRVSPSLKQPGSEAAWGHCAGEVSLSLRQHALLPQPQAAESDYRAA